MRMAVSAMAAFFIFVLMLAGCASQASDTGGQVTNQPPTQPSGNQTTQASNQTQQPDNQTSQQSSITAPQLATHGDYKSCWVLYRGMVYDMTGYLFTHPGGAAIIVPTCGKTDSSYATAFEGQHNTKYSESMAGVAPIVGKFAG